MYAALRSPLKTGIALASASAIAVAPLLVAPPDEPETVPRVSAAAVRLAAEFNPATAYVEAFNTASTNATTLASVFFVAPFAEVQQAIVNAVGDLSNPLNIPIGVGANLADAFRAATFLGFDGLVPNPPQLNSIDSAHQLLFVILTQGFPPIIEPPSESVAALVEILASPLSGVLIGSVGPFVSPFVAAMNVGTQLVIALSAGNQQTAIQEVIEAPADVVGAFFNGATLDLSRLIPILSSSGLLPLPAGTDLASLTFAFGGLLSPGKTGSTGAGGGIGGSIFNSVGLTVNLGGFPLTIPGQGVGPLGALTSLSQTIAQAIGWDGMGNPLANLKFPVLDITPTLSTPTADPAAAAAEESPTAFSVTDSDAASPAAAETEPAETQAAETQAAETQSATARFAPLGTEQEGPGTDDTAKDDDQFGTGDLSDGSTSGDDSSSIGRAGVKDGNKAEPATVSAGSSKPSDNSAALGSPGEDSSDAPGGPA